MACGCTNNNELNNDKRLDYDKMLINDHKLSDNKLSLESIKDLSIDEIVNLYRQGYMLEGTDNYPTDNYPELEISNISKINVLTYGTQCSGTPTIAINSTSPLPGTYGVVKKGQVWAQRFYGDFRCLDFVQFYAQRYNTNWSFYIEIRKDDGIGEGKPIGVPLVDDSGLVMRTSPMLYTDISTGWGWIYPTIGAILPTNAYYWICFVPSDFYDSPIYRDDPTDDRIGLQDTTNATDKRSAVFKTGAWTNSSTFAFAVFKLPTFTTPSNAQVFNMCWGPGLGAQCSIPPQMPVIVAGTNFTIKADIANSGGTGPVRAVFKIDGSAISDQNTPSLATFTGSQFWSPTTTYTMPNRSVTLTVDGYGWNGSSWILTNTQSVTISSSTPVCTGISIDASTVTANVGDTITLTAFGVTPTTQVFNVNFLDRSNNVLGTCTTSSGMCSSQWNTTGLAPGQYYVRATVTGQCTSTELTIGLSLPIRQWSVDITVLDDVTSNPIQGASVTIGVTTLQTDPVGHILFTGVNEGTISVGITKTGYNNFNTVESLFSNIMRTYRMVPVSQNPGNLRFVTSPPGISGAEVHFIGDVPTLKGTTDVNGIFLINGLTAGRVVNYEVRKTGYNTATGSATVVGNVTTDVLVTMTPVSTTGSVCIHSNPSGASIKIDNVTQVGKSTALSGGGCVAANTISNLSAGSHNYELSLTGYQNKTGTFSITVGQTTDYNAGTLTPLPTLGTLNISSTPSGARIYIKVGGAYQDTGYATPATISTLTAGTYDYKLTLTGYDDYLNTFIITAGQTTTVSATLIPVTTGTLSISSYPQGARIYIMPDGGVWQDTTRVTGPQGAPTSITGLGPGNYSYKLVYPIYEDKIGPFTIVIGQITGPIHVDLTPSSPTTGTFSVSSDPQGARIYMMPEGGAWQDTTQVTGPQGSPTLMTGLAPGNYMYKLTLSTYSDYVDLLTITAGQTTGPIHITLSTVAQAGTGGAMMMAAIAAIGIAYLMTKKPKMLPV